MHVQDVAWLGTLVKKEQLMPFFVVKTKSIVEKEVLVEAENITFATQAAVDKIRRGDSGGVRTGMYFEEVTTKKLPDSLPVSEIRDLQRRGIWV